MTAVTIERIAAGGDGVARLPDGMAVFVPRSAPGDTVTIEVVDRKARWARGRIISVDRPGAGRVDPPCPHYVRDGCGGCQLQHLDDAVQRAARREIVGDALRRIGRRPVDDLPIEPPPAVWRYRAKITLAVAADGRRIGLHRHDRPGEVFELDDCQITAEPLMALWRAVREHRQLLPVGTTHLVLRQDAAGDRHLVVRGGEPPWNAEPLLGAIACADLALWWEPAQGAARAVAGAHRGFPPLAFAQVHPGFADRVREEAVAALGPVAGRVVWDLYGGGGDAARLLAAAGADVSSVDADRRAVAWAAAQPRPAGAPDGSPRYLHGRVEDVLHRLPRPDAVLLNPPRTGVAGRVATALDRWAEDGPAGRRCVYVSCDPATLARDLARAPALVLRSVRAWDLFPQTAHVETVAVLETP